jgi:hypothetical protein
MRLCGVYSSEQAPRNYFWRLLKRSTASFQVRMVQVNLQPGAEQAMNCP